MKTLKDISVLKSTINNKSSSGTFVNSKRLESAQCQELLSKTMDDAEVSGIFPVTLHMILKKRCTDVDITY